jgi:hypothetical protein
MTPPTRTIWAYTYRLDPPQSVPRLKEVRAFLEREHTAALARAGTWEGRLVVDDRISHILVLSDSLQLDGDVNRGLEARLRALDAGFSLTVPMAITGEAPPAPAAPPALPAAIPPKD